MRTTSMPSFSQHNVILVRFRSLISPVAKYAPAVVVSAPHISHDLLIVPLDKSSSPDYCPVNSSSRNGTQLG